VKAFAKRIGAEGIGTPVEISGGQLKLAGEIVHEEQKVKQLHRYLDVDQFDVAYGDTWVDIPLLENANRPIAVYPDARLKQLADERGWEIVGDRQGY
jgi:phosphoserine phosphatase